MATHNLLTTPQAAQYLNLSANTLAKWRWNGRGPKYVKVGGAVRYRQDALDAFLQESERCHTSEGAA